MTEFENSVVAQERRKAKEREQNYRRMSAFQRQGAVDLDEMKRRYEARQEQIRRLEAIKSEAIRRGEPIPRRVEGSLAEARISAEEYRMWGNRELTRQIREMEATK